VQSPAALGSRVHGVDFAGQLGQPERDVAVGEEIDLLVGKVDRRLDVGAQRYQPLEQ
jgi:hypothetical protein